MIYLGYVSNLIKALSVLCLPWFTWWTSHCRHDLILLNKQPTVTQAQPEGSTPPAYPLLRIQFTENTPWRPSLTPVLLILCLD